MGRGQHSKREGGPKPVEKGWPWGHPRGFCNCAISRRGTRASNKASAFAIDGYNRTALVINYGSELVSRVQALNARFLPVAGAPDHQSAGGYGLPATGELGEGKGQAFDLSASQRY